MFLYTPIQYLFDYQNILSLRRMALFPPYDQLACICIQKYPLLLSFHIAFGFSQKTPVYLEFIVICERALISVSSVCNDVE